MVTTIWVNIGSDNGLLPDGTKPLPETMLTYQPQTSITEIIWKIKYLKCHWNFPGANELISYLKCYLLIISGDESTLSYVTQIDEQLP